MDWTSTISRQILCGGGETTVKYFMVTFQKDMRRNVIIRARNKRTAKQLAFDRYYIDKKNIIQIKEITKEITKR